MGTFPAMQPPTPSSPRRVRHACDRCADDAEVAAKAIAYLAEGARAGNRNLLIADDADGGIAAALTDAGVPFEPFDVGRVYESLRRPSGDGLDVERMLATWQQLVDESFARGYTGLCVAADVRSFLVDEAARRDFVRYETLVGRYIATHPMWALCLYPASTVGDAFADTACVHDTSPAGATEFHLTFRDLDRLRLRGEIDPANHDQFARVLARLDLDADGWVLDGRELTFIDHRGLLALEAWAERTNATVTLHDAPRTVPVLAALTGLQRVQVAP